MVPAQDVDWSSWEIADDYASAALISQLKKEVGKSHILFDKIDKLVVHAMDTSSDDILVSHPSSNTHVLIVHPTWSRSMERNGFPVVVEYPRKDVPISLLQ